MRSILACRNAISFLAAVLPLQFACGDSAGTDPPDTTSDGPGINAPTPTPGVTPSNPGAPPDPASPPSSSASPGATSEGSVPVNGGVTGNPPPGAGDPGATDPGAAEPGATDPEATEPEPPTGEDPSDDGDAPTPGVIDPIQILGGFRPVDEDLAEDYDDYINEEVGPLTIGTVGSGTARTFTQTIFVAPGVVYDGRGETLTAS